MILKKPYAFLIKHFKIINIILFIPTLYITFCFSDISKYYKTYVANNFRIYESGAGGKYITIWLLGALVIMLLIDILIYSLMKKKQKKTNFYILSIIYFFILFLFAFIAYNNMTTIELGKVDTTSATLMKDIVQFLPYPGYIISVVTLFNGIGFNIKTLKFDQDIDLQITDEDNEEIEIGGNADTISYKNTLVHMIRELKYYILENKLVFICLLILLLFVISSNIYINFEVLNKKYTTNTNVAFKNLIIRIEDSYITNTDQGGNVLAENKYYLALKVRLENMSKKNITVKAKDLLVKGKNNRNIYPSFDRSSKFLDIGNSYLGTTLTPRIMNPMNKPEYKCPIGFKISGNNCVKGNEIKEPEVIDHYYCLDGYTLNENDQKDIKCEEDENRKIYVLVYEISKEDIKKSYELRFLNNTVNKIGDLTPSYIMIKFKPNNLLNKEVIGASKFGEEVDLSDTTIGKTSLIINNMEIVNNYQYEYEFCKSKNKCETIKDVINSKSGRVLVVFNDVINYDKESSYYINSKRKFYEDFATINYKVGNKEMVSSLKDITPINLKNKKVYETTSLVAEGESKYVQLTIRNKQYKILP